MVIAKSGNKPFSVHKSLACEYSPVLDAAFTGQFQEGLTQSMDLNDTTPSAAALLLRWMYTGKLHDRSNQLPRWYDLMEFWLLADKLLILEAQNLAMWGIEVARSEEGLVPTDYLAHIYKSTAPGSPLRKWVIDQVATKSTVHALETDIREQPQRYTLEILADLVVALKTECKGHPKKGINPRLYMVPVPGGDAKMF